MTIIPIRRPCQQGLAKQKTNIRVSVCVGVWVSVCVSVCLRMCLRMSVCGRVFLLVFNLCCDEDNPDKTPCQQGLAKQKTNNRVSLSVWGCGDVRVCMCMCVYVHFTRAVMTIIQIRRRASRAWQCGKRISVCAFVWGCLCACGGVCVGVGPVGVCVPTYFQCMHDDNLDRKPCQQGSDAQKTNIRV